VLALAAGPLCGLLLVGAVAVADHVASRHAAAQPYAAGHFRLM
jgi:hypothetical protein